MYPTVKMLKAVTRTVWYFRASPYRGATWLLVSRMRPIPHGFSVWIRLAVVVSSSVVLAGAHLCFAQGLDESCIVTVLNRTSRAQPDGSFALPNVPQNFGQVRARATCTRDGITTSGESEFFTISSAGSPFRIPEIRFGQDEPIPSSLLVTAPSTELASVGATVQLSVSATFSDGRTADVTPSLTGTNYSSSNPDIVTVSPEGLVTPVSSGTTVVSAMNEGALGMIRLRVTLGGDSDSDGIPDDLELANGLNPADPIDALEDPDSDGLSNRDELIEHGTKIRVADTDDDGIRDGEEVVVGADGFVTNPLLKDTDGDGIRDALEIETGSDPTDPLSFNLAQALVSLQLTPDAFTLTVNTITGQASRLLHVTGNLKDGTTLDLTRTASYSSSDLLVCNFGAEAGRVFASGDGSCIITVAHSGFSDTSTAAVSTFAPVALGSVPIPGFANDVDVSGNVAYVAAGSAGLQVVDVTDRSAPLVVGSYDTPGNANDVKVVGDVAFVADGASGLQVIDVTHPQMPALLGNASLPGDARDLAVRGSVVYVAAGSSGLHSVDVTNTTGPVRIGTVATGSTANGVDVEDALKIAVVAQGSTISTVSIQDPANLVLMGSLAVGDARDLAARGGYAFVADRASSFRSVDISNPASPVLRETLDPSLGGLLNDVVLSGQFALGADIFFVNGVSIVDVTVPNVPLARAILNFPVPPFRDDNATGIAADGTYVYVTADRGTGENESSGDSVLLIGQYLEREDQAEIPPAVSIERLGGDATLVEGEFIQAVVSATDDVAVSFVQLTIGGVIVASDTTPPYQFSFQVPVGVNNIVVGARAVDLGGNVGNAADVLRNVIPDPMTVVVGSVKDKQGVAAAGAAVSVELPPRRFEGVSMLDGSFAIPDVPTIFGNLRARAVLLQSGSPDLIGVSLPVAPNRAGPTNVGTIVVTDVPLGGGPTNPALSCLEIHQQEAATGNGKYWIALPSGVFEMNCDFSSAGGGWTRVGALNGSVDYCVASGFTDMRSDPDTDAGKVSDADARALMTQTSGSPTEVMFFSRSDSRYVWHALENVTDFDTSSKHSSSTYYCTSWHCDNGATDSSICRSEGDGCPITAHGESGFTKKIYVDSSFSIHNQAMHVNGNMCGMPNYTRAGIWVYVR